MIEVENLVGGKLLSTEEVFDDISPRNNTVVASVPRTKSVEPAVSAAAIAFEAWSKLSIEERCDWLDKIADALEARIEEIAELEAIDTGKPTDVALNVDARRSVNNFRFFAGFGRDLKNETFEMF